MVGWHGFSRHGDQLVEPVGHEAPDALRCEVLVLDDRDAHVADHSPRGCARCMVLDVAEQDQRFLCQIELARVDEHLTRCREALGSALALNAPQARLQRRRPGGPNQPVALIENREHAPELARPVLSRIRAILGRPKGVISDKDLRPVRIERRPHLLRADTVVRLPARRELCQRDHPCDRRLAHLRRTRQDDETVAGEHLPSALIRARRHEHASQLLRTPNVKRRPLSKGRRDQRREITQPQQRRHRQPQRRIPVDALAQLTRSKHSEVPKRIERTRQSVLSRPTAEIRCDQHPVVGSQPQIADRARNLARKLGLAERERQPITNPSHRHDKRRLHPQPGAGQHDRLVDQRHPVAIRATPPGQLPQPGISLEHQRRELLKLQPTKPIQHVTGGAVVHNQIVPESRSTHQLAVSQIAHSDSAAWVVRLEVHVSRWPADTMARWPVGLIRSRREVTMSRVLPQSRPPLWWRRFDAARSRRATC